MKDTATINGVTITRAQATKALEEMNRVDPPRPGQRFTSNGGSVYRAVKVPSGKEKELFNILWPTLPFRDYVVFGVNDEGTFNAFTADSKFEICS